MKLAVSISALALLGLASSCIFVGGSEPMFPTFTPERTYAIVEGNGVEGHDVRALEPFRTVRLDGPVNAEIEVGAVQSVTVSCDENLLPRVETVVEKGTLSVRWTRADDGVPEPFVSQRVRVTLPELERIVVSGPSDARVTGLKGGALAISLTGSGCVRALGNVDDVSVSVSGNGDAQLTDLVARRATVCVSGAGNVNVDVRERLDAVVSGSGVVRYRGKPARVDRNLSGTGCVMDQNPVSVDDH